MRQNYMFPDLRRPDYSTVVAGQELMLQLMNKEQLLMEDILTKIFWVEEYPKINKKTVHCKRHLLDGEYELVMELHKVYPERDRAYEQRVIPTQKIFNPAS